MSNDTEDFDDPGLTTDDTNATVDITGLTPGQTRLFPFVRDGERLTGMVLVTNDGVRVYVNRCPHVPFELDFGDGRVWNREHTAILCSTHGAQFTPETGQCFAGPPRGRALERLPFTVEGMTVSVTIPPEPKGWPRDYS